MNERKSQKTAKLASKLVVFALLLIVVALVGGLLLKKAYDAALVQPNSETSEQIDFIIAEGETPQQVANNLVTEGLLRESYKTYFLLYLRQSNLSSSIQAGSFRIPMNLNIKELAETLQSAGVPDVWITIPEGLRVDEVADLLATEYSNHLDSIFNKEEFLRLSTDTQFIQTLQLPIAGVSTLEGFLFPDKYLLPIEATEEYVITAMVDNFKAKAPRTITYDHLIIASMVEREALADEERPLIADIMTRRLNEGWFLNIDATLLYYYKDWKRVLSEQDIDTDHEYNTYTRIGLPPTPISNPGLASINAALEPEANSYYYYIHDKDGIVHFAETAEEHAQNVIQYLQ